ncbi:MAG: AsmA family protein [Gammaproteobacteria bacterium]
MKWILRLAVLVPGIVLALAVMVTAALFILDDEDYRSALVWATGSFLDASLEIRGPFALHLGREASLTAGDVILKANDGSYSLALGEFHTDVRLESLLEGIYWIKSLVLADVQLETKQSGDDDKSVFQGLSIPAVVIEQARLNNINLVFHESDPDKSHEIDLQALVVDDINNNGPLGIQGNGTFQNRPFSIEGRLDSLAQLIGAAAPYAVRLDITSGTLQAHLEGTIAKPLEGSGLDLQLGFTDPQLSRTLRLWNDSAPELGTVTAHMQLRGDYDRPRLEQISAHLQRPGELDLKVTGEIADLQPLDGVELRLDGRSSNPSVISWLLFDHRNRLKSLAGSGTIHAGDGRYRIEALQAKASTRTGVKVEVSGTADIYRSLKKRSSQPTGLKLALDSPTTRSLTALAVEGDAIPELGRVKATARLVVYLDGISLDGLDLNVGGPGQIRATANGSVDSIPFSALEKSSGFNLRLDARAEKSSYLNNYFKLNLPELGAVQARMRVHGGMSSVSLESLELTVGRPDKPVLGANGTVRTGFRRRSTTVDIGFDVSTADLIAAVYKPTPSLNLGRLDGNFTASDTDGIWGVDKFTMISARTSLFQLKVTGGVDDLVKPDQGRVRTMLEIDDVPALGRALGVDLSDFSSYRGQGTLEVNRGRVDYEASNTLGSTRSTTSLTGSLAGHKPRLKGKLDIPVFNLADFGIGKHADGDKTAGLPLNETGNQFLFSRQAFNLNFLQALDLDLTVSVSSVAGTGLRFEQLDARINLQDGVLRASPVKLQFEGGPATLDLGINSRGKPDFTLRMSGNDLSLGPALAEIQNDVPVEGYVNLHVDVSAGGDSPHDLASSLDGTFGFGLENARVPRRYIEFLAVDVFGWAFNTATRRDPYANLDCVMAGFDIRDGVATSNLLAADGPSLAVAGTAILDFGDETMDMTLLPKQRKSLFSELSPVHIKGPLRDPKVTALPVKSAVTSLGTLALVPALPMVAIPAILGEKLWASLNDHHLKEGGCVKLAKKLVKQKEKKGEWWKFW